MEMTRTDRRFSVSCCPSLCLPSLSLAPPPSPLPARVSPPLPNPISSAPSSTYSSPPHRRASFPFSLSPRLFQTKRVLLSRFPLRPPVQPWSSRSRRSTRSVRRWSPFRAASPTGGVPAERAQRRRMKTKVSKSFSYFPLFLKRAPLPLNNTERRQAEAARIRDKYPDRIPVSAHAGHRSPRVAWNSRVLRASRREHDARRPKTPTPPRLAPPSRLTLCPPPTTTTSTTGHRREGGEERHPRHRQEKVSRLCFRI